MDIETLIREEYESITGPKPRYPEWFFMEGGPMANIKDMVLKMKDALIKTTIVPACPEYRGHCRRYLVVCQQCEDRETCQPFNDTVRRIEGVTAL